MERATLHWGVAVSVSRWTGGACAIVGGWARRRKRPAWPSTIAVLRADEAELRWAGIRRLSLFGSVARGDADAGGDIDLAVEFDPAAQMDLIRMVALERRVGATLGRSGDILPEPVEHRGLGRMWSETAGLPSGHGPVDSLHHNIENPKRVVRYLAGLDRRCLSAIATFCDGGGVARSDAPVATAAWPPAKVAHD